MRWDEDIKAMDLTGPEKDGLQLHRNYSKKFEEGREERFKAAAGHKLPDIDDLKEVFDLICSEDIRFVPVIACAFGRLMILGGEKAAAIQLHPLLVRYHQEFTNRLNAPGSRLMIIGYSFAK